MEERYQGRWSIMVKRERKKAPDIDIILFKIIVSEHFAENNDLKFIFIKYIIFPYFLNIYLMSY